MPTITFEALECKVCEHVWIPRIKGTLPKSCPKCGSIHWQTGRRRPPVAEQRKAAALRIKKERQSRVEKYKQFLAKSGFEVIPVKAKASKLRPVSVPLVNWVPCGECAEMDEILSHSNDLERIEISGELASKVTPNSWTTHTRGMSMSNGDLPNGIGDDDVILLTPFNEFNSELRPGMAVLAKIKYKNGNLVCTLKEYGGTKLKARNPRFKGVDFGPDIQYAEVLAVCRGIVEKVFV